MFFNLFGILNVVRKIYEKILERKVKGKIVPEHLVIITEAKDFLDNLAKFHEFTKWCRRFKIKELTICLNFNKKVKHDLKSTLNSILKFFEFENVNIIADNVRIRKYGPDPLINFLVNYNGKKEITSAVKKIAKLIEAGKINPEDVNEEIIENYLCVKRPPDLIIRAGREIPNFLIWQSIYSELYFLDMDWKNFRYLDFLRCLKEYQRRERRYGR